LVIVHVLQAARRVNDLLRHDRGDHLEVSDRVIAADLIDDVDPVQLEIVVERGDEILAQLLLRSLRSAGRIARLAR